LLEATILLPLYMVLYKTSGKKMIFVLVYAVLAFVLLMSQSRFQMAADNQMIVSGLIFLVLQIGLWIQYYFWGRHQPEALTQGGNFEDAKAEEIRQLLTSGRLDKAIDKMVLGDELSAEQQTVVSNFAYRLNEIKRKETMGLLTDEDATVERNKIVTGILSFL